MELHQLRYFMAVARFNSFTRAAEHEHVAQPSLSQQIRKLEDELGVRLFDRLGRRIRLTPFGVRFQDHARRVQEEVDGARQEVEELLGLRRGTVWLGAIPTIAPYLLPRTLADFAKANPKISVSVREDLTDSLLGQLAAGDLDLALMSLPIKGSEFVAQLLFNEKMLLAVPTRHRLWRRRRPVALGEVAEESFLLLKDGHCFRDDVLRICQRSRLSPNVVFEGGQFDTLVAMVEAGAGVTLLPEMARPHYRRAGVGMLEFLPPQPARNVGFIRSREKFLTPAARAFIKTLEVTCATRKGR
ncbi:MAG: LysR family transcriptional regulator [Acidobacteria bacterium]|nr:LysR family transcriptional regulator [Acidobacteriota bacterium]